MATSGNTCKIVFFSAFFSFNSFNILIPWKSESVDPDPMDKQALLYKSTLLGNVAFFCTLHLTNFLQLLYMPTNITWVSTVQYSFCTKCGADFSPSRIHHSFATVPCIQLFTLKGNALLPWCHHSHPSMLGSYG